MDRGLFFFAGGEAFWWALPPLLLLLVLATRASRFNGGTRVFVELGLVLTGAAVFLGGPPVASWVYFFWIGAIVGLVVAVQPRAAVLSWPPRVGTLVAAGITLFPVLSEWSSRRIDSLPPMSGRRTFVIGDSLTAGIADHPRLSCLWPPPACSGSTPWYCLDSAEISGAGLSIA